MTTIEWTDETWNPTLGCTRVSPGCDGCYAIGSSRVRSGNPHPAIKAAHAGLTEHRDGRLDWTGDVRSLPGRLDVPLHWRKPRRIFVDSMSDLFHDQVSDEFIGSVFEVMAKTPQHTYQLLTKRHGRMRSLLRRWAAEGEARDWAGPGTAVFRRHDLGWVGPIRWPLPNVWLGVSVEDQARADLRIPALLETPAAVRFLSCEPLLGPVDLGSWLDCPHDSQSGDEGPVALLGREPRRWRCDHCGTVHDEVSGETRSGLGWVIAGGETGPKARPAHPDWLRELRDQCAASDVAFFLKQWGDWAPTGRLGLGSVDPHRSIIVGPYDGEFGEGHEIARVGKKAAGRELDGRTHDDFPLPAVEEAARA